MNRYVKRPIVTDKSGKHCGTKCKWLSPNGAFCHLFEGEYMNCKLLKFDKNKSLRCDECLKEEIIIFTDDK